MYDTENLSLGRQLIGESFGTKHAEVHHLVAGIDAVLLAIKRNFKVDKEQQKALFISGLESAKRLPDYGEVTEEVLTALKTRAEETNWNSAEDLWLLRTYVLEFLGKK